MTDEYQDTSRYKIRKIYREIYIVITQTGPAIRYHV